MSASQLPSVFWVQPGLKWTAVSFAGAAVIDELPGEVDVVAVCGVAGFEGPTPVVLVGCTPGTVVGIPSVVDVASLVDVASMLAVVVVRLI